MTSASELHVRSAVETHIRVKGGRSIGVERASVIETTGDVLREGIIKSGLMRRASERLRKSERAGDGL